MSVACIDGDFIPFISCYNKADDKGVVVEKSLEEAILNCDNLVKNILIGTKCTDYIIALTKGKCFRYNIYPEYKANRKYKQQLNYFQEVKQHLIDRWKAVYYSELEADDIVNICRLKYKDGFIVSVDKDLLNLQGEHFNPKDRSWVVTSANRAMYELCMDMIIGQPGDNIRGLKGRGKVYAESVLSGKFGDPEILDTVFRCYMVNHKSISEAIDNFYLNFKCLNILDKWDGFVVPTPIKVNINIEDEFEERVVKE